MWTSTVKIDEEELNGWRQDLVLGDLLDKPLQYDVLVDNEAYNNITIKRDGE